MRRFSIIQAPLLALYSKPFYRDVAEHWQFAAPIFLLIVVALSWVPTMVTVYAARDQYLQAEVPPLLEQMPAITIADGVVSANPEGPTYLKWQATGTPYAIIDTGGTVTSLEGTDATVLLTRTAIIVRKNATETRTYDLSRVKEFSLDRDKMRRFIDLAAAWITPGVFLLLVCMSAAFRFLQALVYGAVGRWFAKQEHLTLGSGAAVRLAMISLYPAILVKTALESAHLKISYSWLMLVALALAYLWMGVRACRPDEAEPGRPAN